MSNDTNLTQVAQVTSSASANIVDDYKIKIRPDELKGWFIDLYCGDKLLDSLERDQDYDRDDVKIFAYAIKMVSYKRREFVVMSNVIDTRYRIDNVKKLQQCGHDINSTAYAPCLNYRLDSFRYEDNDYSLSDKDAKQYRHTPLLCLYDDKSKFYYLGNMFTFDKTIIDRNYTYNNAHNNDRKKANIVDDNNLAIIYFGNNAFHTHFINTDEIKLNKPESFVRHKGLILNNGECVIVNDDIMLLFYGFSADGRTDEKNLNDFITDGKLYGQLKNRSGDIVDLKHNDLNKFETHLDYDTLCRKLMICEVIKITGFELLSKHLFHYDYLFANGVPFEQFGYPLQHLYVEEDGILELSSTYINAKVFYKFDKTNLTFKELNGADTNNPLPVSLTMPQL